MEEIDDIQLCWRKCTDAAEAESLVEQMLTTPNLKWIELLDEVYDHGDHRSPSPAQEALLRHETELRENTASLDAKRIDSADV